jgi:hypothetical protein
MRRSVVWGATRAAVRSRGAVSHPVGAPARYRPAERAAVVTETRKRSAAQRRQRASLAYREHSGTDIAGITVSTNG